MEILSKAIKAGKQNIILEMPGTGEGRAADICTRECQIFLK